VGICLGRSVELVISMLAILKAGGAYLPLDPDYPLERLTYMVQDASVELLLGHSAVPVMSQLSVAHRIWLDSPELQRELDAYSPYPPSLPSDCGALLAYVNYTSGSTGQPKGVLVEHRNVTSLVCDIDYVPLNTETVMLLNATIAFDAATFEVWGALLNGGRLVFEAASQLELSQLWQLLQVHQVNTAWMTAGLFEQFVQYQPQPLEALKYLLVGGDVVSPQAVTLMQQRHPSLQIINGYGPTENTTFSTYCLLSGRDWQHKQLPIGRPLAHRQVYVLDRMGGLVPQGIAGELYVGGAGLSRGYLNQADLTAERFVEHSFGAGLSTRLYKTGDVVRWSAAGELEYLGRNDEQVKIRGYRIEPGEIVQALNRLEGIAESLVVVQQHQAIGKRLIAYVRVSDGGQCDQPEQCQALSRQYAQQLKEMLPEYMQPSVLMVLAEFPLTAHGKIDRRSLPAADVSQQQQAYVAPQTETEQALCALWQELLGVAQVGVHDNFFALGGHSLLATRLVAQLKQREMSLSLREVFQYPHLSEQAALIDGYHVTGQYAGIKQQDGSQNTHLGHAELQRSSAVVHPPYLKFSSGTTTLPLFLFPGGGADALSYQALASCLNGQRTVFAMNHPCMLDDSQPVRLWSVEELADYYLTQIKQIQPQGPYCLAGWSYGGVVSLAIAQKLTSAGDTVQFLGLIDSVWRHQAQQQRSELSALLAQTQYTLSDFVRMLHSDAAYLAQFDQDYRIELQSTLSGMDKERQRALVLAGLVSQERALILAQPTAEHILYCSALSNQHGNKASCELSLHAYSNKSCRWVEVAADHQSIVQHPAVTEVGKHFEMALSQHLQTSEKQPAGEALQIL
jgi:amino acid adenylation domain-containing protein